MKILVTGGAGFMGSNFIRYMLDKYPDYKIINYDCLDYAGLGENLKDIENNPNYKFILGNILNYNEFISSLENVDAVIHYAAQSHVDNSISDPFQAIKTNIIGTNTVLEACKNKKVARFIFISTDEVFGSITKGSFSEEDKLLPNSPYSAGKAGADLICRAYTETYNTPVIITHSCNNVGPYQHPEKLTPLFITNLIEDKKVPVYGNGKNVREWIYVLDHAKAIDTILHKGKDGQIYNIGTGFEKSNLEITHKILSYFKMGDEMIEYVTDRLGHDFRYSINSSKLRSELGWTPEYDFDTMFDKTIQWYIENPSWWKRLKK